MKEFKLIGLYEINPTVESLFLAARFHKYDWLIDDSKFIKDVNWSELKNLGLLELQVFGEYSQADLSRISHKDQAPYLEFYLDPSGTKLLDEDDATKAEGRRVCFFLHFIDVSIPLIIDGEKVLMPIMSQLPNRLFQFTHYVPVD